ncbi:MAG: HIT domain-containing protein [Dehalococcoidia bacterium]|jgi:ATP adenylyltransferase
MKKIWAPWRATYILKTDKEKGCILCDKPDEKKDKGNYILYRGKSNFIILNAYPYTPGHLMVAPYRHIGNILDLSVAEGKEQVELIKLCVRLLTAKIKPAGFNIGMNLGRVAGAGVEGHIHTHVVPRWNGDHNFMTVLADTRVLSESLETMYAKLKAGLKDPAISGLI